MYKTTTSIVAALVLICGSTAEAQSFQNQDFDLNQVDTIVGYEVLTAPRKGKGFIQVGDEIHLRPSDSRYVAVHVERDRQLVHSALGSLVKDVARGTFIAVPLSTGENLYLTPNEDGGFTINEDWEYFLKGDEDSASGSTGGNHGG